MGYWILDGGTELCNLFYIQAQAKKCKYLTSFGLRDLVRKRVIKENAEFVTLFDPEHCDYYRITH